MTGSDPRTTRRTFLRASGAAAAGAALAGCTGLIGGGSNGPDEVVLAPPENYERRQDMDLPYPTYGEQLPSVTLPAPLQERPVSTTEFVGERHAMLTFVYTNCTTVCPGLTASLRHVQADSVEEGYAAEFAFLPTTFDPEADTPEQLRSYCDEMGVNFEAGNWYFLRPETPARAREVVEGRFGVAFERGQPDDDGGNGADGDGHGGEMDGARMFTHTSLVLLVNKDGFVERAYNGAPPEPSIAIEDARELRDGWS